MIDEGATVRECSYADNRHRIHAATKSREAAGMVALDPEEGLVAHMSRTVNWRTANADTKAWRLNQPRPRCVHITIIGY